MTFKMQCFNAKTPRHIEVCVCVCRWKLAHITSEIIVKIIELLIDFDLNQICWWDAVYFQFQYSTFFLTFRQICTHKTGNNLWPKWNASLILHRLIVDCYYLIAKCYADQHYYISEHAKKKQQTLSHIHTHTHGKYERGPFLYTNALVLVRLHRMKSRVSTLPSIGLMAHIVKWNDINAEHSIMCVFSVRTADVIYHQQSVDLEFSIEHKAYGLAHICMPHHIVSHST